MFLPAGFCLSAFICLFLRQVNPQAVAGKLDAVRQFRLGRVVVKIVRQMGEESSFRADAPRRGQRLVQAHVGRMRRVAQGVEHGGLDPAHLLDGRGGTSLQSHK